ncbi:MAG: site-specific integrase [Nostoc sp. DedQUE04]|uniref:site-specific integrase n=1 Tax=Nostoc sp. DedQUE04 TaxID=3075390 RepID=UPI002AD4C045|nr:site-specific integrase [Nostoc sp. DedQUE04]MDZ8136304.1 site-specific integrase [Nostoc sp. DedQUE04]
MKTYFILGWIFNGNFMKNIEHALKEANGRLRIYGIKIEQIGVRLYLRATLPPKPLALKNGWHQQKINITVANLDGVKLAEKEGKLLRLRLDTKTFDWNDYLKSEPQNSKVKTIGELIQEFEKDYFERRQRNFKTESTWKVEYQTVFKTLPQHEILNTEVLKQAILTTTPDTRTRKRFCLTLQLLAKFADLDFNPNSYSGSYSYRNRQIRSLPTDKLIFECHSNLADAKWQWIFGMLATYGLRNHEVFFLDLEQLRAGNKIITVLAGKTGYRKIWPFHPKWFDSFGLPNVKIPEINLNRNNSAIGRTVTQRFRRNDGLPFRVYDLRHAWAIRTLEYGIDITLAAQQMGHSLSVHSNLYHAWINAEHHQRAFDLAMNKSDRPLPPE